jgi:sugar/nucleoside kinase (ribokinase family)
MTSSVLGVGHPFCDRTRYVDDAFLQKHDLRKDVSNIATSAEAVDLAWYDTTTAAPEDLNRWTIGGSGPNVIKVLARLGHPCSIRGKVGNDSMGNQIEESLKRMGINPLLGKGEKRTGLVNCFTYGKGERTMQAYPGATSEFSVEEILLEDFQGKKHLHLEGYHVLIDGILRKCVQFAKEHQLTVSFDLASKNIVEIFKPQFLETVPSVDCLFGNTEEMQALTGIKLFSEASDYFKLNQIVVATDGAEGCWVKHKNEKDVAHYDALKVIDVVDTTGAGDFFAGGFLHGYLGEREIPSCVQMGNLAAGAVISQSGADLPENKWAMLKDSIGKV